MIKNYNYRYKREKLIQLIHVGKNKIALSEDDYRNLLAGITGKTSCADMNISELASVFHAIKDLGFTPCFKPRPKSNRKMKVREEEIGKATAEQLDYIKALWELAARVKTEAALQAFVKRIAGVPFLRWLDVYSAQKVILALRDMAEKAGVDPDEFIIKK
ncbi:MAG: regulatory protein GemA [Treponemataceae bacterium]